MNKNMSFNFVRENIKKAKLNNAITVLDKLIENKYPDQYNQFIILCYRYNTLVTEIQKGLIERNSREEISIVSSMLSLIDSIEYDTS